ncbi:MAG: energy transducer TonB [Verrucomicrobia bacterium]|nr:energy transducer TonB [Verrucomicrobiota bacterium]
MTSKDCLIRRPMLLAVLGLCASTLPAVATDPGPTGIRLSNGGNAARFGSYATQVQSGIKEALVQNSKTRTASISGVRIRLWIDNTARVARAQLVDTTGNTSLDSAITDEVLPGLQLKEPPPADMPMPILLRLTAHPSPFGLYAAQVQTTIEAALLQNNKTRTALISKILIRIWVDNTGRVTRAQLVVPTANPSLDAAITNDVLVGLQLKGPPPADMPMPIQLRVTTHPS